MKKRLALTAALLLVSLLALVSIILPDLGLNLAAPAAALNAGTVFDALEATLGEIYAGVSPSVVNIQVGQDGDALTLNSPQDPGLPFDPSLPQEGLGSGFVWDREGHIITNNHVVDGATRIRVTFADETTVPAEVVGTDPHSDLAVIKVDLPPDKLQPVRLADSTEVEVGQLAVAIGNPFGLEGTMTVGFVSALGRSLPVTAGDAPGSNLLAPTYTIPDIIQTDAPINPGNSGGVLVNDEGLVIGVPTAIESPVRANAGIGFAVPSTIVQKVVPVLIEEGAYEHTWLGISGTSLDSELAEAMGLDTEQRGVLVIEVVSRSPAGEAGLQASDRSVELARGEARVGGDIIVAINGQPVGGFDDLVTYLARYTSVGDVATLTILRDGRQETVEARLAARPTEGVASMPANQGTASGAWLGIQGLTLTPEIAEAAGLPAGQEGVLVAEVIRNTPAGAAGLRGGDRIIEVNGQQVQIGGDLILAADDEPVSGFEDLRGFLLRAEPGQEVTFALLRDGDKISVAVTLGERPASTP
jgi:S1-C subfamily serine protease